MSLTQDAASDQRWAAAQKIADGEMDERMPRRRRIVWLWMSALIVGSVLLGVLLTAVLPPPGPDSGNDDDGWSARLIIGALFQVIALVVGIGGFSWAVRTGRYVTRWRAVASPLKLRERTWVIRQIRSAAPIDDDRKRSVVLAVATQNRRAAEGLVPIHVCLVMLAVSVGLLSTWAAITALELVVVLSFMVLYVFIARDYRRAGVYLATFGGHTPPPTDGTQGQR